MIRRLKFLKDRVRYPLDKKILKRLDWRDGDIINQELSLQPKRIVLFNLTFNERLRGTPEYEIQDNFFGKEQDWFKKMSRRYGIREHSVMGRGKKRFYKKIEDWENAEEIAIKKENQLQIKAFELHKKEIFSVINQNKKSNKEFVNLIKNKPKEAIGRIKKRQKLREQQLKKEIRDINKKIRFLRGK